MTEADAAPAAAAASAPARDDQAGPSTRERILDVAMDLFTDQGFDATSMREIAERLGISKPAIYYHFASKEEILMALHMRLHQLGKAALARLAGQTVTLQLWESLLNEVLDQMVAQRKLFLMHERNQAAMEKLHRLREHDQSHEDLEQRLRHALTDPSLPLGDRVRMACSLGAAFGGLFMFGNAFEDVPGADLRSLIGGVVHGIVADHSQPSPS
ncbi:MAG TPA: TetR family transcriptional regulator [Streptosporangiaceae bacterium]|nr:TetR family transcriptional regulator [Streptosporangiaceae bacterium]